MEDPNALRTALMRAGAVLEFRGDMLDRRFDRDAPPTLTERDEVLRHKPAIELELMRALKRTLDPHNLMNPGKVL